MLIGDIIVTVVCIIIVRCICSVMNKFWFKPRKLERILRQQGLKGKSYRERKENSNPKSSVIEKSTDFTNDYYASVFPDHHQLGSRYGDIFFTWIGPAPILNITNPDLISEVFSKMQEFHKLQPNPLTKLMFCGLASHEGEIWDIHRKLLNPAFHLEYLKFMLPSINISVTKLVNEWDEILSKTSSYEIDVCPYIANSTADAISRTAFGSTYEEGKRIFELLIEQQKALAPLFTSMYIPGWKYVPTIRNWKIFTTNAKLENLLKKIIEKKQKAISDGEIRNDDLLGILIDSYLKKKSINYRDLIDECKLFYFVGHETTAMLIVWTIILLSKHQDWQIRAREEVLATFGMDPPDFDGLHRLKIMKMILNEVLRLYPPAPLVSRTIRDEEATLGNLNLSKGVLVRMFLLHAHHNPKFWGDDAKEFKPERFANGIKSATNGTMAFFPFGWGQRSCIGQNFSIIEAKVTMSLILQRFSFELSPSYIHSPISVITLKPKHGAQVIIRRVP